MGHRQSKLRWKTRQGSSRISTLFMLNSILTFFLVAEPSAQQRLQVDLELVLAVDVSSSIDDSERALQRRGYVEAFRSKKVIDSILNGLNGAIAVTYFEWSGSGFQQIVVPWTIVSSVEESHAFSRDLQQISHRPYDTTSISSAMIFAADLFTQSPAKAAKKVLDISGDGPNNQGERVDRARDWLVSQGIVINGLPLLMKPHEFRRLGRGHLQQYYRQCVIGGPGAFFITAKSWEEFPQALQQKLVLEIAGADTQPLKAPVHTVGLTLPPEGKTHLINEQFDCSAS